MKLCSFQVDMRIPDDLSEKEQDALLEAVDALNLPLRLRRCLGATLAHFITQHEIKVTVNN